MSEKQSKTNVTARMGRKVVIEQQPKVIRTPNVGAVKSVVTAYPAARSPQTDEESRAVAEFDRLSKELKKSNPKTSTFEAPYAEAFLALRRLGLVQ